METEQRRESEISEPGSAVTTDNTDNEIEVIDLDELSDEDVKKKLDQFGDRDEKSEEQEADNEEAEERNAEDEEQEEGEEAEDNEEKEKLLQEQNGIFQGLSEEQQDEVFSSEDRASVYQNFIVATFLMFTIPCGLMYASYKYLFLEHYHLPPDKAALYGGIVGIFSVYVIIAIFIYIAYHEEKGIEQRIKKIKSQ
ncbi:unnamed protein product [Bursaphelenchus okinawaensis]|uniref:Vacuolar ATPase assembly integral membrane protein VMA21 homolog n=1 Tax=Bursaphelenchus okinawaensis TaxID=465554 RepID=A0A811KGM1_9BILA|nr:unnamed protein product [Bursaphelenchus okinawaensis]CAG9102928.1 unnamed protein product [Bursaphelenchus okinawaensis]